MQISSISEGKPLFKVKGHSFMVLSGIILIGILLFTLPFIDIILTNGNHVVDISEGRRNIPLNSLGSTNPASPTSLSDDVAISETYTTGPYYYKTAVAASSAYYHVVWLSFSSSNDFDLLLYSDSGYTTIIEASDGYDTPEWVVFRPSTSQTYYQKTVLWTGAGWAYIEWEDSSSIIPIGDSASSSLSSAEGIEVYQVLLSNSLTYNFALDVPAGANYDLYLYYLAAGSTANSEEYTTASATGGIGIDEIISNYHPSTSGNYTLLVVWRSGSGTFTLRPLAVASLSDGSVLSATYSSGADYYYQTAVAASASYYHVVWLNFDAANDFDLNLYNDSMYSACWKCSWYSIPEWVVFRPKSSQRYYPQTNAYSGSGWAYIQWEDSSTSIIIGQGASASLSSSSCIDIYQVSLTSGSTYSFLLDVPTGADYDLYLYYLPSGGAANYDGYTRRSATASIGSDEQISNYKPTTSGNYILLVVRRSGTGYYDLWTSGGTITVTTPDITSSWKPGTSYAIYWTTTGGIPNVKIELYDGTSFIQTITTSTSNDGYYSWFIPDSTSAGSNYRIKITSTSDSGLYDYSDYFEIKRPMISGFDLQYILLSFIMILAFFFTLRKPLKYFKKANIGNEVG